MSWLERVRDWPVLLSDDICQVRVMPESVDNVQGGGKEPKLHLVTFAKIRGVRKRFDCVFTTEVSRSNSECTRGSDWARAINAKALCRVQLHFNTIPVKRKGKKMA